MIYQLMKRDPAWKIGVLAAAVAVLPMLATRPSRPLTALVAATPILGLFAFARPQQRATQFEAALPVPGRDLYLARLGALLAAVWGPFAIYAATGPYWSVSLLEWAVLATLLILLPLSARVREFACPVWMVAVVWIAGTAAGAAGLYLLSPAVFLGLCALAVAAVFLKTWVSIPPSFQTAPAEAVAPRPLSIRPASVSPVWWTFARQVYPWFILFYVLGMLEQSLAGSWMFAVCFAIGVYGITRQRRRWLQGLPIARRVFLLLALLPAVLPMVAGAAFSVAGPKPVRVDASRAGTPEVQVPLEYWRHAAGGVAPVVRAPWGETVLPKPVTLLRYPLYNPYSVGPENSTRFMRWQYGRARDAMAAQPFTQPRLRVLYVTAIFVIALGFAWLMELQSWFRLVRPSNLARRLALATLLAAIFLPMVFDVTHGAFASGSVTTALLRALLLRIAGRLPGNLAVVVAAAAVPVLPMLRLLDRQMRESEWPDFRPRA
jgi:hypothetical protein